MTRSLARRAAASIVVGVAALLPWAFAGMLSWIWRGAEVLLVLAFAIFVVLGGGAERLIAKRPLWLVPAGALCLWAALQLVPLPPWVLGIVSPEASRRLSAGIPGFGTAGSGSLLPATLAEAARTIPEGLPPAPASPPGAADVRSSVAAPRWHPLSIAPAMTGECLAWYVALLAGALALWGGLEERGFRRGATFVLFGSLGALALAGLIQLAGGVPVVPWSVPVAGAKPIGPYVNPRHFAGVMEMAAPWMAGYALGASRDGSRRVRIVAGVLAVVAFGAGLGGASRLAAVTMAAGLTLLAFFAAKRTLRLQVLGAAAAVWALGGIAMLATPLGERVRVFMATSAEIDRLALWKAMLPALGKYWLTGAGYGTFRWLAPPYIPAGDGGRWLQLHNDWLESVISGGVIGFALLLAAVATTIVAAEARLRRSRGSSSRLEQIGLLVGLASLSLHAAVDFNHQIPANALLFVVLAVFATSRAAELSLGEDR